MATQFQDTTETASASNAEDTTICFQLHVRMPTSRRKGDIEKVDLDGTDPEMISISKALFDSDEFRAVRRHVNYIKAYVRARALPSPLFKGGVYQMPLGLVESTTQRVDEMREEFHVLVEKFLDAYVGRNGRVVSLVEEARNRLKGQFREEDYPSEAELRRSFGIETSFIETRVPTKLGSISQALFKREQERAAQRWRALEVEMSAVMRAEFKALIDRMVDSLGTTEDGKKKAFRRSGVDKLAQFLEMAPFRNVTNDDQLGRLVETATRLLKGVDVEAVKDDDKYRAAVRHSMEQVQGHLEKLVTERPRRAIDFGGEA